MRNVIIQRANVVNLIRNRILLSDLVERNQFTHTFFGAILFRRCGKQNGVVVVVFILLLLCIFFIVTRRIRSSFSSVMRFHRASFFFSQLKPHYIMRFVCFGIFLLLIHGFEHLFRFLFVYDQLKTNNNNNNFISVRIFVQLSKLGLG